MIDSPDITIADLAEKLDAVLASAGQQQPRFLTIDGGAAHVSLSQKSIRRMLSEGKLQAHRPIKGRVLIDRIELEALVLSATQRPRKGRGIGASNGL